MILTMAKKRVTKGGDVAMLERAERRAKVCFTIKREVLDAVERLAKSRGVSVSRAVEYVLEQGVPVVSKEAVR